MEILVASSNPNFRRQVLNKLRHFTCGEAQGGADAVGMLEAARWRTLLLDLRLPDLDPDDLAGIIRERFPQTEVWFVDSEDGEGRLPNWPSEPAGPVADPLPEMIGNSDRMNQVFQRARLVACRNSAVLITGETGTGKELVARGIHKIGPRADGAFVVVNCAAIPESLLEAELFGYVRGAFTGAFQSQLGRIHTAHGGVLFLDEVGDLPLSMQAKLLRFLQEGEVQRLGSSDLIRVDVRVIAATNQDLEKRIAEGQFRQDLYYRIAVFPLQVPPLRERRADIGALAASFLERLCRKSGAREKRLATSTVRYLEQQSWPGNARELQHAMERAWILSEEEAELTPEHFQWTL